MMALALPLEEQSVADICFYLEDKGFPESLIQSFRENEMDGAAIAAGLASTPCSSWLKELTPHKMGLRLKLHSALKLLSLQGSNQGQLFWFSLYKQPGTSASSSTPVPVRDTETGQQNPTDSLARSHTLPMAESTRAPSSSKRLQANALPKPFPIPIFRQSTESNFQNKILTDTDRKYVVQTLSTILMTYTQKVSMYHCAIVAKALIAKYDFLKDTEGDGEHSWKWFFYYRTQNVNRASRQEGTTNSRAKRPRLEDHTTHLYPALHGEDEVSYGRNVELLKAEMVKSKPRPDVLKYLMTRTFANRWSAFVDQHEPSTLLEYLSLFPLLKKTTYANIDFNLACKKDGMRDDFEARFPLWARAIITYCKDTQVRSTALQMETADYTADIHEDRCAMMALRCLTLLFTPTKTKKLEETLPYILKVVPRGTTSIKVSQEDNHPHIVFFSDEDPDSDEMKQFFVCVDHNLMLQCSNIVAAIYFCVGAHYIFNLNYHPKSGDVWVMIQEKILGIPSKFGMKRYPSNVSHFSGISRIYESLTSRMNPYK